MVFASLAFLLFISSISWKRFGLAAPVTFFLLFASLNILTMFLFEVGIYEEGRVKGAAFVIQVLPDEFRQTALIYAIFGAVVYTASITGGLDIRRYSPSELEANRALTNRLLEEALFSPLIGLGLVLALAIYAWHFASINKSLLIINFRYLTISNPQDMGLSNPILSIAHNATGPLGVLLGAMMVYYFRRRASLYGLACFILTAYFIMLKMAGFSRWAPLIFAAILASLIMMRVIEKLRLISIGVVAFFFLSLLSYILVLEGRGSPVQGLAGIVVTVVELDADPLASLSQILINVSIGALTTATSFARAESFYPIAYKILSFSPFPSALDDFRSYLYYTAFINSATPYSGIAEALEFGEIYFIVYFAINAYCIRLLTRSYLQLGPVIGLILSMPAYFAIMAMHTYPVRNSLRLLLYATLITLWAASKLDGRISKRHRQVSGPQRGAS